MKDRGSELVARHFWVHFFRSHGFGDCGTYAVVEEGSANADVIISSFDGDYQITNTLVFIKARQDLDAIHKTNRALYKRAFDATTDFLRSNPHQNCVNMIVAVGVKLRMYFIRKEDNTDYFSVEQQWSATETDEQMQFNPGSKDWPLYWDVDGVKAQEILMLTELMKTNVHLYSDVA